jgi:hypothetical protein
VSFAKLAPCILIEIFVQTTPQDVLSLRKVRSLFYTANDVIHIDILVLQNSTLCQP